MQAQTKCDKFTEKRTDKVQTEIAGLKEPEENNA